MTDLVTALAERLQLVVDDATYADNYKVVCGERLAREALAWVAKQLPTREEIAIRLYVDPAFTERWEEGAERQWQGAHDNAKAFFLTKADALLRDWRERLGI